MTSATKPVQPSEGQPAGTVPSDEESGSAPQGPMALVAKGVLPLLLLVASGDDPRTDLETV